MSDPRVWTFTQLGGSQSQLTLTGWCAPFGRPRQGAIVNAGNSIRYTATRYPGRNSLPTIHTFGNVKKPMELHGRWMDPQIGSGGTQNGAQAMVRDWNEFIEEAQVVRAQWGEILSYKVFIHDFDAWFEDPATVAWAIKAEVLQDEFGQITSVVSVARYPSDVSSQLQALLVNANPFTAASYPTLRGFFSSIADNIDTVVGIINAPAAVIFDTCEAISDFETAISSDLGKMMSSCQTIKTALVNLRENNAFLVNQAIELDLQMQAQFGNGWLGGDVLQQMTTDAAAAQAADTNLLALIADLEDQIDRTQRGRTKSAVRAADGDSWESIGIQQYGSAGAARAIKNMNGVRYGQRPVAGQIYQLPTRT